MKEFALQRSLKKEPWVCGASLSNTQSIRHHSGKQGLYHNLYKILEIWAAGHSHGLLLYSGTWVEFVFLVCV